MDYFRQVVAAFLTMSMFLMLGNMIKREHIDPLLMPVNAPQVSLGFQHNVFNVKVAHLTTGSSTDAMRPCWKKFSALKAQQREQSEGYVHFSLTNGPEYHVLQIANAIFIAKHLRAKLVLPDIQGTKGGEKRAFGEIYDTKKFITSLDEIIEVVNQDHSTTFDEEEHKEKDIDIVKIPKRVTTEFINSKIEPIFRKKKQVRLMTSTSQYPSLTFRRAYERSDHFTNPYACLAIFGSLKLKPELEELVEMMVRTLQFLSLKSSGGQFVAVDLRVEELEKNKMMMMSCKKNDTSGATNKQSSCFGAKEIGQWMKKIGFGKDATIYITQTGWHKSLQPFREYYPNIFTKDSLMPLDMRARYLNSNNFQYDKYIDFYLSVKSNVFVPTSSNLFYASVSGLRIASGNTQIIAPPGRRSISSSSSPLSSEADMNYLSPYVLNKTHIAYSCLC
ncbi:OLC1v1036077C1 [Oldenlandia corymbosa var. corymbosa]|uniref:O-fucosyltransferase family protein n=1 Tax=Oldenlandia corymbosa var. corymbosa TaxID=529605 RepID=A0AAV1CUK1_OLDCO|nr:OLC1v1036077C1 [Oldenlandia corymbosa var. corymbosa]